MNKRLDKNLQKWAESSPKEALMLPYLKLDEHHTCVTELGEPNLSVQGVPLHDPHSAVKEAEKWAGNIEFRNCKLCYVYGIGLGYHYQALRPWLKKDKSRMVVFLEDDLGVIKRFMETEIAEKLLKDPQVRLHHFSTIDENDRFFETLYWNFALQPVAITAISSYIKNKSKRFEELSHKISFLNAHHNAMVEEYVNYGGPFFYNFYQNLLKLPASYSGNKLFGKFKGVPAIICGAGPSLERQMDQIAQHTDRALIFGCGSAMNALNAAGIMPHFGAAIDPNSEQLKRLKSNTAEDVPYFYRNRVYHEALNEIKGPHLYITGCGGYGVSDWFEDKLKIPRKELEEGYNVVNFSIELAKQLGCNPIIIVGCDLAYTGMKAYADGVVEDSSVTVPQITVCEDFDEQAIIETDIFGKPTYTLWKWVSEAKWIGEFAANNKKIKVLNATEGGIGFPGVINCPFSECVSTCLSKKYDLKERIEGEIRENSFKAITEKKILKLITELSESLVRCEGFLDTLIKEGNELIRKVKESKKVPDALHSGAFALAEFELSEEPGYTYVLSDFNSVYALLLSRSYDDIRSHMPRTPEWKKFIKGIELNNKKFIFLSNTSRINRALIQMAVKNHLGIK